MLSLFIQKNSQGESESPFVQVNLELSQLQTKLGNAEVQVATFAGGCFWCMEGPFEVEPGVVAAIAGFSGGELENPSYRQVIGGGTGHREAVQVYYKPKEVSYERLLEIYGFQIDPTDDKGQFADRGEQYTPAIFYSSESEKAAAEKYLEKLSNSGIYEKPIMVLLEPFRNFYPAEDYHQDFYKKSAEYYKKYKLGSGREAFIQEIEKKWSEREVISQSVDTVFC